eukprot:1933287-Pleurochrysis_carterae.AAC.2
MAPVIPLLLLCVLFGWCGRQRLPASRSQAKCPRCVLVRPARRTTPTHRMLLISAGLACGTVSAAAMSLTSLSRVDYAAYAGESARVARFPTCWGEPPTLRALTAHSTAFALAASLLLKTASGRAFLCGSCLSALWALTKAGLFWALH